MARVRDINRRGQEPLVPAPDLDDILLLALVDAGPALDILVLAIDRRAVFSAPKRAVHSEDDELPIPEPVEQGNRAQPDRPAATDQRLIALALDLVRDPKALLSVHQVPER